MCLVKPLSIGVNERYLIKRWEAFIAASSAMNSVDFKKYIAATATFQTEIETINPGMTDAVVRKLWHPSLSHKKR